MAAATVTLPQPQLQPYRTEVSAEGPSFESLMNRYAGQEGRYLHDPNYVPDVGDFYALQMLSDDIRLQHRFQPNSPEDVPQSEEVYVGPNGEAVDADVAQRVRHLADPATWLRSEGDEWVFSQASNLLNDGDTSMNEDQQVALFNSAENAATGTILDPGSLDSQKLINLANLSRISRRQLEREGADTEALLSRRPRDVVTASAAVPGQGMGYDEGVAEAIQAVRNGRPVVGRASVPNRRGIQAQIERPNHTQEDDYDTLLRLMQDDKVVSEDAIAATLYPEKIASGLGEHNIPRAAFLVEDVLRGAMRRITGRGGPSRLDNLTTDERARVAKLTTQLRGIKRLEKQDTEHYRAGLDRIPAMYEISAELFPEAANRELTEQEMDVVEKVRARLERHHERQAKPDRFMRLRIAMANARKEAVALVADAKLEVQEAKEFMTRNARMVRVAGAAALALTVAIASPDMKASVDADPKATRNSAAVLTVSRRGSGYEVDNPETSQLPEANEPYAGERPDGTSGQLPRPIQVEYR